MDENPSSIETNNTPAVDPERLARALAGWLRLYRKDPTITVRAVRKGDGVAAQEKSTGIDTPARKISE